MMTRTSSLIPSSQFSTEGVAPAKRYEAFRESIGVVFEVTNPVAKGADFGARIDSHLLGEILMVQCETNGQRFTRSSSMIGQDSLDHYLVQLFLKGHTQRRCGNAEAHGGDGKIIVIDASQPWRAENSDFSNLTLVVPRRHLASKLTSENDHHGRMIDIQSPFGQILCNYMLTLKETVSRLTAEDAYPLTQPSTDLVAAALNHECKTSSNHSASAEAAHNQAMRLRLRRHIDANLSNPYFDVEQVLNAFNMSRAHLYRLFASDGGVARYLRNRRLDLAYRQLLLPRPDGQTIGQVAFATGFRSETVFRRAFKQRFGVSPGDVRNGTMEVSSETSELSELNGRIWEEWFRRL